MLTNTNEIEGLKEDFAFLKKIRSMDKRFRDRQKGKEVKECSEPSRTNFIMHPKMLSSDSDDEDLQLNRLGNDNVSNENISLAKTFSKTSPKDLRLGSSILINEKREFKTKNSVTFSNMSTSNTANTGRILNRPRPSSVRFDHLDKKLNIVIEKNIKFLNDIRFVFQKGISPPDGEEDFFRRTRRVQEFSSRFSRNYLYQLTRHAMKNHTELLLDGVNEFNNQMMKRSQMINNPERKKAPKSGKIKSKLSMYDSSASFRRDPEYRKAFEAFSKKKFNVKSKYKTAAFKHRPPIEKPHIVSLPSKTKLFPKRSSGAIRTPRVCKNVMDEDVETLVENENELQVPENSTALLIQNDVETGRLAPPPTWSEPSCDTTVRKDNSNDKKTAENPHDEVIGEEEVRKAIHVLQKCLDSQTKIKLDEEKTEEMQGKVEEAEGQQTGEETLLRKNYKEPKVTSVTGVRNAKLICIRDDNSLVEEPVIKTDSKENHQSLVASAIKICTSQTQTDCQQELDQLLIEPEKEQAPPKISRMMRHKHRSHIKISRLPSQASRKQLELLPKNYAIGVIQYKLQYHNFHKENALYRKSTHILPWVLMGRISDEVLNQLLGQVVTELEVNPLLENLYNAEFQY